MTPMLGIMASQISGHLTPTSPVAGYYSWYDAADTATINLVGSGVNQWNDKGSGANNFTQSNSTYRPSSGTRSQNGKNIIDFDGTNDNLSFGTPANFKFLHSAVSTCFFAVVSDVTTGGAMMGDDGGGSSIPGFAFWNFGVAKISQEIANASATIVSNASAANIYTAGSFYYFSALGDPGNGTAANRSTMKYKGGANWNNNTLTGAVSTANPGAARVQIGDEGYAVGPDAPFNGGIGEIIIYNTTLSTGDVALNNAYLAAKWGV